MPELIKLKTGLEDVAGEDYSYGDLRINIDSGYRSFFSKSLNVSLTFVEPHDGNPGQFLLSAFMPVPDVKFGELKNLMNDMESFLKEDPMHICR